MERGLNNEKNLKNIAELILCLSFSYSKCNNFKNGTMAHH